MFTLSAKIREKFGKETQKLRTKGIIPVVLYGPKIKNLSLEVNLKELEEIYKKAGESSLISVQLFPTNNSGKIKKFLVLIHEIKKDPLTGDLTHVDFYQPILTKEIEAPVSLVFEGDSLAVKELGGTLIKEIQELTVKALPQHLPHEIKVNIDKLKTFEDEILIKDLRLPEDVKVQREPEEIVAIVTPPGKIEEELEQPVEEKVEGVEEAGKERGGKEEKEKPAESPPDNQAGKLARNATHNVAGGGEKNEEK